MLHLALAELLSNKGRFRRLKYLDRIDTTLASRVITAACILHNLCIDLYDETEMDQDDNDDDNNFKYTDNDNSVTFGCIKRVRIAGLL